MAEAGTGKTFGKVLQRTVFRTKEKVLQNLGKADKTTDDLFEQHVTYFNEQQAAATRLQKELKHYTACVKEMSLASQSMYRAIKEVYEPEWTGFTEVTAAVEQLQSLWEDYVSKISDQLHAPLVSYAAQFPDMKAKIAKRNRKLTDYDSARHTHDSLTSSKKPDEAKISKATDEMNEAKLIYETINVELNDELPSLFSSRIPFVSSHLNMLCTIESVFQHESAKLKDMVIQVTDNLSKESANMQHKLPSTSGLQSQTSTGSMTRTNFAGANNERPGGTVPSSGGYSPGTPGGGATYSAPVYNMSNRSPSAGLTPPASGAAPPRLNNTPPSPSQAKTNPDGLDQPESSISNRNSYEMKVEPAAPARASFGSSSSSSTDQKTGSTGQQSPGIHNGKSGSDIEPPSLVVSGNLYSSGPSLTDRTENGITNQRDSNGLDVNVIVVPANGDDDAHKTAEPSSALPIAMPLTAALNAQDGGVPEHRILFKVLATHKYVGEDIDELTFDIGEIITVVPFDDPDEQDDGWLMGVKESTKEKGVFPENFTKRL